MDLFIPHDNQAKFNTTNEKGLGRRTDTGWTMSKENEICSYTFLNIAVNLDNLKLSLNNRYQIYQNHFVSVCCFSCYFQVLLTEKQAPLMLY